MNPCDLSCPKCGSANISREFCHANTELQPSMFQKKSDTSDFVDRKYKYMHHVLKDCIINNCRCCQYCWDTAPLSSGSQEESQ